MKVTVLLATLLVGACTGSSPHMRAVAPESAKYSTQADKALVVFMRPSGFGRAINSSLFDVTSGTPELIGIVSYRTRLAHYATPGKRRFMVVGESADFMGAEMEAGKVYYALVSPRLGAWKARFSLRPIRGSAVGNPEFDRWYRDTRWMETTETAAGWAAANMPSISQKMAEDTPQWENKAEKPMLVSDDGKPTPYSPNAAGGPVTK